MASKKFLLTPESYYSPKRPHLSNSQVSDYLKSPEYYVKLHVTHELKKDSSPSMKFGSMVDALLCGGCVEYEIKTLKKDDPEGYERQQALPEDCFVSAQQYTDAEDMASFIKKQKFWYEYSDARQMQPILEGKIAKVKVCGKLDILDVVGEVAYLDDLKTAAPGKAKNKDIWVRTCYEYGYLRQLAFYRELIRQKYKDVKKIVCRHIVASKIEDSLYKVQLFTFSDFMLDQAFEEVEEAIKNIKARNFTDPVISWNSATHVGDERSFFEEAEPEEGPSA